MNGKPDEGKVHDADNGSPTDDMQSMSIMRVGGVVFGGITALWIATLLLALNSGSWKPKTMAELGDAFGSINALFSGLALVGVVVGLFYQSREFAQQVSEMKAQTRHFEQDVQNLIEQNEQMRMELRHSLIQAHMKALPVFEVALFTHLPLVVRVTNLGAVAYEVLLRSRGGDPFLPRSPQRRVDPNGHFDVQLPDVDQDCPFLHVKASYITSLGASDVQEFVINFSMASGNVMHAQGGTNVAAARDAIVKGVIDSTIQSSVKSTSSESRVPHAPNSAS